MRENKIKSTKQPANAENAKRSGTKISNNENCHASVVAASKRSAGKYNAPTKSSSLKSSGQAVSGSTALGTSNKVNSIKIVPRNTVR